MDILIYTMIGILAFGGVYAIIDRICTCAEKRAYLKAFGEYNKGKVSYNDIMKEALKDANR